MKKLNEKVILLKEQPKAVSRYKQMMFWNWLVIKNKKYTTRNYKKFDKAYTKDLLGIKPLFTNF